MWAHLISVFLIRFKNKSDKKMRNFFKYCRGVEKNKVVRDIIKEIK